jgi:hypothetical protein
MTSDWKTEKLKARKRSFVILCHLALAKKFDGDITRVAEFSTFGVEDLISRPINIQSARSYRFIDDMMFLLTAINEYLAGDSRGTHRDEINIRGNYKKISALHRLKKQLEEESEKHRAFTHLCLSEMERILKPMRSKDE